MMLLGVCAFLVLLLGHIWLMAMAFMESRAKGYLAFCFGSLYTLVFGLVHWDRAKIPCLMLLIGSIGLGYVMTQAIRNTDFSAQLNQVSRAANPMAKFNAALDLVEADMARAATIAHNSIQQSIAASTAPATPAATISQTSSSSQNTKKNTNPTVISAESDKIRESMSQYNQGIKTPSSDNDSPSTYGASDSSSSSRSSTQSKGGSSASSSLSSSSKSKSSSSASSSSKSESGSSASGRSKKAGGSSSSAGAGSRYRQRDRD